MKKRILSVAITLVLMLALVHVDSVSASETYEPYAAVEVFDDLTITFESVRGRIRSVTNAGGTLIRYYLGSVDNNWLKYGVSFSREVTVRHLDGMRNGMGNANYTKIDFPPGGVEGIAILNLSVEGEPVTVQIFTNRRSLGDSRSGITGYLEGDRVREGTSLDSSLLPLEKVGETRPTRIKYDGSAIDWKALYKNSYQYITVCVGDIYTNTTDTFALADLNGDGMPELLTRSNIRPEYITLYHIVKPALSVRRFGAIRKYNMSDSNDRGFLEIRQYRDGTIIFWQDRGEWQHLTEIGGVQQFRPNDGGIPGTSADPRVFQDLTWHPYSQQNLNNAVDGWSPSTISDTRAGITVEISNKRVTSVTLTNVTQQMVDSGIYVGIYRVGAGESPHSYLIMPENSRDGSTGISAYAAPTATYDTNGGGYFGYEGEWEIRFIAGRGLVATIPLKDTSGTTPTASSDEIKVLVNGTAVIFDQPPIIQNGRTLVPLRVIFEALGATVNWNQSTQTVTAVRDDTIVSLTIGSNTLNRNGEQVILDVPAQLVGGRTLVPARAVAESFGASVDWDAGTRTVMITE
jgi:hypothetical protein